MRHISILLILSFLWNSTAFAQTTTASGVPQTQESAQTEKFRQEVQKRGAGEKSRVKIKLSNGTEVKGYISKIDESSFEVTDKKTTQTTTISYSQVQKIQGPGLSKVEKIGIGVGVAVAVVVIIVVIAWVQFDHSKGPSFPI
jgi:hypothetical protein